MADCCKSGEMTEFVESDSSQHSTPTYDDDDGGKRKSDQNDSYNVYMMNAAADSSEIQLDVTSQKKSLFKLKNTSPSKWNDTSARHVYAGFKVTRYIVENNYIFNPNLDPHIPLIGELIGGTNSEWWSIKKKLEEVLGMFYVPGAEKMANGLHNYLDFVIASGALSKPSKDTSQKYSTDAAVKAAQKDVETEIHEFVKLVEESYMVKQEEEKKGKRKQIALKLNETSFEAYLECLFRILGKFASDDENLTLNKSTYTTLQFTTSTLETLVCPKPDFYVKNPLKQVAAVVEVKPHYRQLFPFYRSHRFPTKKMKTSQATLTTQDEEEDMEMEDDSSTEMISEETVTDDKLMDDSFENLECLKEENKGEKLDEHIRYLRLKEKKQVRCFLPQLIAELMGVSNTKGTRRLRIFHCLQYNTAGTKRFGIGLVGVKARFVTMIIRDANGKTPVGPSDIEDKSVSTNVYMTRELNLFKKSHLMMFFEILYAMGKLTFV